MCSLTIVNGEKGLIFTHNRDEDVSRHADIKPIYYEVGDGYFAPTDPLAGGTWIGFNAKMAAAILNGAYTLHERKLPYKGSRGGIIHELFQLGDVPLFIEQFDPKGLEAFTLVMARIDGDVTELVWDENQLHVDTQKAYPYLMYSSSTLYDDDIKWSRKKCFEKQILSDNSETNIWDFHNRFGEDHHRFINTQYNAKIRSTCVFQVVFGQSTVRYVDLIDTRKPARSLAIIP